MTGERRLRSNGFIGSRRLSTFSTIQGICLRSKRFPQAGQHEAFRDSSASAMAVVRPLLDSNLATSWFADDRDGRRTAFPPLDAHGCGICRTLILIVTRRNQRVPSVGSESESRGTEAPWGARQSRPQSGCWESQPTRINRRLAVIVVSPEPSSTSTIKSVTSR
jgi:hypothetical protein